MKNNRRDFLKLTGMAGLSVAGTGVLNGIASEPETKANVVPEQAARIQHFNMSGYAAPKLDVVRIGFIGLGNRGPAHLGQVSILEGVDIKALCDLRQDRLDSAKKRIEKTNFKPDTYTGKEDWKKVCERKDIDLIFIATPWVQIMRVSALIRLSQNAKSR